MFIWVTDVNNNKRIAINPFFIRKMTESLGGTYIEFITDTDDTKYFVVKELATTIMTLTDDVVRDVVEIFKGEEDAQED